MKLICQQGCISLSLIIVARACQLNLPATCDCNSQCIHVACVIAGLSQSGSVGTIITHFFVNFVAKESHHNFIFVLAGSAWYNYDNANDCANYCPDLQVSFF